MEIQMSKVVGLSLSSCIDDILCDRVMVENVAFLITSTCARTPEEWEELITIYCGGYTNWGKHPAMARYWVDTFLLNGLLIQPRVSGMPTVIDNPEVPNVYDARDYDHAEINYYPWIPLEAWERHYGKFYNHLLTRRII
jgi:hypothetical protein